MKAFGVFPGQGSQKVGMGTSFFDNCPEAREIFARADEALGFSISKLCFEGPDTELVKTAHAQPAILTVSIAAFESWKASIGNLENYFLYYAGHSLGEYSALVAAGALNFEDAVRLVHLRGQFMQEAVPSGEGAMIAILGLSIEEIEESLRSMSEGSPAMLSVANDNAPGQVVLAGSKQAVEQYKSLHPGRKIIDLAVSAPFHCPLMQPAAERLNEKLHEVAIRDASIPVIANFTAKPVQSAADIRNSLYLQVCGRVRWTESVRFAQEQGVGTVIEFGNSNVLTGLTKRISPELTRKNISTFADLSLD